jgi:hypothetical protein
MTMTAREISECAPASSPVTAVPSELAVTPSHQLEGIELRSLAGFAALFYGAAFIALGIGVAAVWFLASLVGLVGQFEEFMQSIGFRDFQVLGPKVIFGGLLAAFALVAFLTVMTVLAGALYNVMARHGHMVRVRLGETPPVTREPPPAQIQPERSRGAFLRTLRGGREPASSIAAMDAGGVPARLQQ